MNIKHIIIVILIIIVFLLIMIGKGNDRIDKDVTKAISQEAGISITNAVPEPKESTSNEGRDKQVSEKSISAEAEIEEKADQHISGTPTPEEKSAEDQNQHISGK